MKNPILRIAIACFTGALIGSFISLQVMPQLWLLGVLIGALVGYLTYDWKEVGQAFVETFRAMCAWRPNTDKLVWAAKYRQWKNTSKVFSSTFSLVTVHVIPVLYLAILNGTEEFTLANKYAVLFLEVMIGIVLLGSLIATPSFLGSATTRKDIRGVFLRDRSMKIFMLEMRPMILLRGEIRAIAFVIEHIPTAIIWVAKFVKKVFILIHSEMRLLCGVDAAIGTVCGYYFGNTLVGAIAGALFGVLNYRIVTVRILRLRKV